MSAVRTLMMRRRAQGGATAAPFVQPTALTEASRLAGLEAGTLESLRKAAEAELNKAKAAFSEARGLSWTAFLNLPLLVLSKIADYRRWRPISELIDQADKSLAEGDRADAEDAKRRSYASAWTTARVAQGAILREAGEGKTGVVAILKEEATQAGVDPQRVTDAGKKLSESAQKVGEVVKWAALGLTIYGGLKLIGGLRG